jgi:hypothetical protein
VEAATALVGQQFGKHAAPIFVNGVVVVGHDITRLARATSAETTAPTVPTPAQNGTSVCPRSGVRRQLKPAFTVVKEG